MFDIHRVEIEWGGRKLKLETGHMARQADAAVYAQYGETSVLATVVGAKSPKAGIDFFPLTVNYQERTYAAGKIPGGYFKREGRPSEKETLVSRLIDRPIRPLFVEGFKNEVQVVVTTLSFDIVPAVKPRANANPRKNSKNVVQISEIAPSCRNKRAFRLAFNSRIADS